MSASSPITDHCLAVIAIAPLYLSKTRAALMNQNNRKPRQVPQRVGVAQKQSAALVSGPAPGTRLL
jgi:hypothetical protein